MANTYASRETGTPDRLAASVTERVVDALGELARNGIGLSAGQSSAITSALDDVADSALVHTALESFETLRVTPNGTNVTAAVTALGAVASASADLTAAQVAACEAIIAYLAAALDGQQESDLTDALAAVTP